MPLFRGDTSIVGIIQFVIGSHLVVFVVLPSTNFKLVSHLLQWELLPLAMSYCVSQFCRWEYVQLQSGDDSLWESFPHILESM